MRHRPEYVARSGSPGRATAVRARRLWIGVAALGVAICATAGVALAPPATGLTADSTTGSAASSPQATRSTPTAPSATPPPAAAPPAPAPTAVPPAPAPTAAPPAPAPTAPPAPAPTAVPPAPAPTAVPLAGVPTELRLTDTGSPIRVVPIGVTADGVLDPPADVATAGWWVAGPRPGGPGRTVITGHIDSRAAGLGAFAALDDLQPGDRISVDTADAQVVDYLVTGRDQIEKTELDPAVLAGTTVPDLLLVTCIGVFDADTRSYESNLLITAVPVVAVPTRD